MAYKASTQEISSFSEKSKLSFKAAVGYDFPSIGDHYPAYDVSSDLTFLVGLGYSFNDWLSLGADYQFIFNSPVSRLPEKIFRDSTLTASTETSLVSSRITRQFLGIGPSLNWNIPKLNLQLGLGVRAGYTFFNGGDLIQSGEDDMASVEHHLGFTGFNSSVLSGKSEIRLNYNLSNRLSIELTAYYMRHFNLKPDSDLELLDINAVEFYYGQSDVEIKDEQSFLTNNDALLVVNEHCVDYSSIGISLGLIYRFGKSHQKSHDFNRTEFKNVIVEVEDRESGLAVRNADVLIRDSEGEVVATGRTNSLGTVTFTGLNEADYFVEGALYDIQTTNSHISKAEFNSEMPVVSKLFYEDLRFVLEGRVVNQGTKIGEPGVVVILTENNGTVKQDNSDGKGAFAFQLDKSSIYEVVGVKENRLSEIERVTTVGLDRSTTLYVDLELGVEDFECDQGTVLDIKYEFDQDALLPASRYDLDRLIRYMSDHEISRVELSSHTDCRGPDEYNLDLSQRRAQSAVDYIRSRGISIERIVAQGYGEKHLLNQCEDGIDCSEGEHRINRRTEAKLLCN